MTRWVFAALVLANLGLLMWASWYRGEPGMTIPPRPVFHPELIVPITTPGVALKARRNERNTPLVATKPKMRCVSVGPFPADAADPAAAWLIAEKLAANRRSEERRIEGSYWVHLGPFENRKQAEARLHGLEQQGIRDLLIMQDAQGRTVISFGLFIQPENAERRRQELKQKGIDVKQETRYRTEIQHWLDLRVPEPADESVQRLRSRDWGGGAQVTDAPCPPESG